MLGKWSLAKDSSTNIGDYYFTEGGRNYSPTPGVYYGIAENYFNFKSNGIVDLDANSQSYNATHKLYPDNKLGIGDTVHDPAMVIKLTATEAKFDLNNTSPNGGKYFRRTYLKK